VLLVAGGASLAVAHTSWVALVALALVLAAASLCFEARYVPGWVCTPSAAGSD
jgi:hypothetical protein